MGITLEDVLEELKEFKDTLNYYLTCVGYKQPDLMDAMDELEQRIRETKEG